MYLVRLSQKIRVHAPIGLPGGCGTFYAITIASSAFSGLSMIKQHKLVTETLKQEIEGIHGLQVRVYVGYQEITNLTTC